MSLPDCLLIGGVEIKSFDLICRAQLTKWQQEHKVGFRPLIVARTEEDIKAGCPAEISATGLHLLLDSLLMEEKHRDFFKPEDFDSLILVGSSIFGEEYTRNFIYDIFQDFPRNISVCVMTTKVTEMHVEYCPKFLRQKSWWDFKFDYLKFALNILIADAEKSKSLDRFADLLLCCRAAGMEI